MTLEKDKSKVNSKLSVLDMKWENHDVNVVDWVNIPKFPPLLNGDPEKMLFCG